MAARIVVEAEAVDRLAELSLDVDLIEKVVRRAEAEAATCTAFDPPMMGGLMRYGRSTRFLREELVPAGWDFDNPRNFCRTIHPSRAFAVVATSGDENTGNSELTPATKNPKGYATIEAVAVNEQLAFDFPDFDFGVASKDTEQLVTWFLLYHVFDDEIRAELSQPSQMNGGTITEWAERIILPSFPRDDDALPAEQAPDGDDQGEYVVEVNRR
jgi:hypothetical protein